MSMRNVIALAALVWAIILSMCALWLDPQGIIDASVLVLLAQILVFIASIFGLKLPIPFYNYGDKGNTKVAKT